MYLVIIILTQYVLIELNMLQELSTFLNNVMVNLEEEQRFENSITE